MSEAGFDSTSITLLARLRTDPGNPPAWKEFVRRYGPLLQKYCENWGLQEADAQDIAQEVLIKLVDKLKECKAELFNLRFQAATGQLESHGRLRAVRTDIARIYTIMRERELGITPVGAA